MVRVPGGLYNEGTMPMAYLYYIIYVQQYGRLNSWTVVQ